MTEPTSRSGRRPGSLAGGVFFAIGPVLGVVIGTLYGQPSIGMIAGAAAGLALVGLVWLLDRRR